MSLAKNVEFLRHFPKLNGFNGFGIYGRSASAGARSPLVEIGGFGTNPGALKMFAYVPEPLPRASALVVVLHGCGQTAAGYDFGTGWSTLAKRYGFALLMPEQQAANNANTCFNWFNPGDVARGRGEAASIRQMVARMVADHNIDPRRIYITGLSAGGAMTSVMLATYPEVFAGGAIIAGLPLRHRQQCPRSARRHDAVDVAPRRQTGRSRPQGLQAQAARGRKCRCGTAAPIAPSIPATPTRSSSNGSTSTACRLRRCRQAMSTAIRATSGGMPTARPSSNPTPSPTWPMARRLGLPAMTSPMARKARS